MPENRAQRTCRHHPNRQLWRLHAPCDPIAHIFQILTIIELNKITILLKDRASPCFKKPFTRPKLGDDCCGQNDFHLCNNLRVFSDQLILTLKRMQNILFENWIHRFPSFHISALLETLSSIIHKVVQIQLPVRVILLHYLLYKPFCCHFQFLVLILGAVLGINVLDRII